MENNSFEVKSESDIIEALENGALNPRELNKPTLKEYIRIMRNRGYSSSEIGRLLKITPRSVQRHVKKIREEFKAFVLKRLRVPAERCRTR